MYIFVFIHSFRYSSCAARPLHIGDVDDDALIHVVSCVSSRLFEEFNSIVMLITLWRCEWGERAGCLNCDRLSDDQQTCPYQKIVVERPRGEKASQQLVLVLYSFLLFTGRQHSLLCKPCTSHRRDVRPSVRPSVCQCLSVCLSHAGTKWKQRKLGSRNLHQRIGHGL